MLMIRDLQMMVFDAAREIARTHQFASRRAHALVLILMFDCPQFEAVS